MPSLQLQAPRISPRFPLVTSIQAHELAEIKCDAHFCHDTIRTLNFQHQDDLFLKTSFRPNFHLFVFLFGYLSEHCGREVLKIDAPDSYVIKSAGVVLASGYYVL